MAGHNKKKAGATISSPGGEGWAHGLVDSSSDLICLCENGKIAYINPAGLVMLGLKSAARASGRRFSDFMHSEHREIVSKLLGGGRLGGKALSLKLQRGRGKAIDAEFTFKRNGPRKAGMVIVQARDITEKLRAAEAVLRSETQYRHLVESALDMICVCEQGVITYINEAGAAMLREKTATNMIGRELVTLVHPDYREVITNGLDTLASELNTLSGSGSTLPLKFVRVDGELIDVEIAIMPFGAPGEDSFMLEVRDITERLRSTGQLREREQRLDGIMNTVVDAIITTDEKGIIQTFNPAATKIFGYSKNEVIGQNVKLLVSSADHGAHDGYIRDYKRTGKKSIIGAVGREEEGLRKDGTTFPLEISVTEMWLGQVRLFTGIIRDITNRKRAQEELKEAYDGLEIRVEERTRELTQEIAERHKAEDKLRLAAEVIANLTEAVLIVDQKFKVLDANPAFTEITGFSLNDVSGKVPSFYKVLKKDADRYKHMQQDLRTKGFWNGELWDKMKSGDEYALRLSVSAIFGDEDADTQYAIVLGDITKRKQDQDRIYQQANFDALTGLPNRALFHDRLDLSLSTMNRANRKLGLMFIDLDGFKLVNDTLGHDIGDLMLKEAARRLTECVRKGDTVARLGGDEFTVIMPNLLDPRHAPLLAQRILDALAKPFQLKDHESFISGSIGVTIFPEDAIGAYDLIKNADSAMYRAKDQGKANYQFYTADMNAQVKERLAIKNGLSKALKAGEFSLFYQPKLELGNGRITGVEALMRWNNVDLGSISPVKFVPVLEETGMVVEVGEWALRTACLQHNAWIEQGLPPIRIAVNLSARQLREKSFIPMLKSVMKKTGVKAESLEIEITESMLMSDSEGSVIALNDLHDMGFHIAMDDFGTGYSSLSYLKRFPIDTIKIDRSFVSDIATNEDDAEIIKTIISMGQTLNRRIVAEGVETQEQLDILKQYRCDEIQGYLFSRPLPSKEVTSFLMSHFSDARAAAVS